MDEYRITDTEIRENSVDSQPHHLSGDAEKIQKIFDALPTLIARKFNDFVTAVSNKFKSYYTKDETDNAINDKMIAVGNGDMASSKYDANADGTVNDSDRLGGQLPSYYATVEALDKVEADIDKVEADAEKMANDISKMMPKANFVFDSKTQTLSITL